MAQVEQEQALNGLIFSSLRPSWAKVLAAWWLLNGLRMLVLTLLKVTSWKYVLGIKEKAIPRTMPVETKNTDVIKNWFLAGRSNLESVTAHAKNITFHSILLIS